MSTIHRSDPSTKITLHDGQRLDRATFLELYEQTPPGVKAELIAGVVQMGSPVGWRHGRGCLRVGTWLGTYGIRTPGVEAFGEVTTALDDLGVPQPDLSLRIAPSHGGLGHYAGKVLGGPSELIVEVADSSRLTDLGAKRADYERAGVLEYIVVALDPDEIFWHVRQGEHLVRIAADPDGLYRARAFPGLWLDPRALLDDDGVSLIAALERGLATAEHANFAAALAARARE